MRSDKFRGEIYFHVIKEDRKLRFGDGREVLPGKELKAPAVTAANGTRRARPVMCGYGMHGCKDVKSWDLFAMYSGRWLCVVRIWGKVKHSAGGLKSVGLRRKVVAMRQIPSGYGSYPKTFGNSEQAYNWVMAKPWKGPKGKGK